MAALMFVSCKPTEANYKAAYDAAKARREQAAAEQMRPASGLLSDDGPQLRVFDGDTVYINRERLRYFDGGKLGGKWAVAVSMFKMDTNAKAAAEAISEKGFPHAMAVKAPGGKYYTVCDTVATLDDARVRGAEFVKAFPEYPFVGLPGAPVLIAY